MWVIERFTGRLQSISGRMAEMRTWLQHHGMEAHLLELSFLPAKGSLPPPVSGPEGGGGGFRGSVQRRRAARSRANSSVGNDAVLGDSSALRAAHHEIRIASTAIGHRSRLAQSITVISAPCHDTSSTTSGSVRQAQSLYHAINRALAASAWPSVIGPDLLSFR